MYEHKRIVTSSEAGADGMQTLLSTVTMMQDCSQLWMESEPVFTKWLEDNGLAMVLASRQLDILRRPRVFERLSVRTSVYKNKSLLGYRNTFIYDQEGLPVAKSWGIGAFITLSEGKMVRPPQEVTDSMVIDPMQDMEYLPKKVKIPQGEARRLSPLVAQTTDIDFNGHVNNAQYIRMALNCLPEDFEPKRLRVEYKSQCRKGDVLVPVLLSSSPNMQYVTLENLQGEPYTIMEFSHC